MKWISVKDRSPQDCVDVLGFLIEEEYRGCDIVYRKGYKWIDSSGSPTNDVYFWMPLPEPPKE